jgi:DNA-binding transcriptional LysR family regulator
MRTRRAFACRLAPMSPDADDLLLFARVAESGSFSRAAERVQLPKSTVSRRIAALEKRLGERLLQRTTRKLVITDFGQGVLDHARAMSEEVDAALAFALSRQARPSGRLRVSMPGDFASLALERPLAGFIRDYPDVALELDLSPRRVDLIGENFDLAIRMGTLPDDSQLAARRLAVFTTGLYAAPSLLREHGEPLAPEALHTMPALMLLSRSGDAVAWELSPRGLLASMGDGKAAGDANGSASGQAGGNGSSPGDAGAPARRPGHASAATKAPRARRHLDAPVQEIVPSQHVRANSPDVLIRLARSGAGVVAVADFFAEPYLVRGELQRILPAWCLPDAQCWAVFPGRRLMPAKTRAFIDMLARTMSTCSEAVDASAAKLDAPPGRFRVD